MLIGINRFEERSRLSSRHGPSGGITRIQYFSISDIRASPPRRPGERFVFAAEDPGEEVTMETV
jgi:hypothetical protein